MCMESQNHGASSGKAWVFWPGVGEYILKLAETKRILRLLKPMLAKGRTNKKLPKAWLQASCK